MRLNLPDIPEEDFTDALRVEPLTRAHWPQFTALFGPKGACANCWCMYFRRPKAEFDEGKTNEGNKNAMKALVWNDMPTGIICFYEEVPVAWCAFAPRVDFDKLKKSRVHRPIDDQPVWSIPCMFIAKPYRRLGVSVALLKGVIAYARQNGINIIEAYPTIPTQDTLPDAFAWIGLYKSFERAGFEIVDRSSKHRPMVRFYTDKQ